VTRKLAVAGAALAALAVAGCTTVSTAPDQEAVKYGYGWTESGKPKGCTDPSHKERHTGHGLGDRYYYYPAGQRTFDFTGGKEADSAPFGTVSKDNVQVSFAGVVTFQLDTNCDTLRKFHEQIGLKFSAFMDDDDTTSDGWTRMVNIYIGQPLHRALATEASKNGYRDLYNNDAIKQQVEAALNTDLAAQVQSLAGGTYFGHFALKLQRPTIPEDNQKALAAEQVAVAQNNAQKAKNVQINTEIESIRALVKVLGPNGYILYKAIQDGKVTVMPIPMGNPLSIPVPTR
jgi:hypothetical protein